MWIHQPGWHLAIPQAASPWLDIHQHLQVISVTDVGITKNPPCWTAGVKTDLPDTPAVPWDGDGHQQTNDTEAECCPNDRIVGGCTAAFNQPRNAENVHSIVRL